jgi:hypothetical protein
LPPQIVRAYRVGANVLKRTAFERFMEHEAPRVQLALS